MARDDDAQGRIAALDPATRQKTFAAVVGNTLQVDQLARYIQRHQQGVTTLAQAMRTDAFGDEVRVGGISAARIAPPTLSADRCLELALLLLGFALALGLLDALTYFDCFAMIDRFTRAPSARPAILPAAKCTRRNAVQVQDIPAVFAALSVAGNVEAMNHTARFRQPIEWAINGLKCFTKKDRCGLVMGDIRGPGNILQASRGRHRRLAVLKIRHELAPQIRVAAKHLLVGFTAHRGTPEQRFVGVGAIR
ncbi:hypothetical protein D3C87_1298550 [compost metagenome]